MSASSKRRHEGREGQGTSQPISTGSSRWSCCWPPRDNCAHGESRNRDGARAYEHCRECKAPDELQREVDTLDALFDEAAQVLSQQQTSSVSSFAAAFTLLLREGSWKLS